MDLTKGGYPTCSASTTILLHLALFYYDGDIKYSIY